MANKGNTVNQILRHQRHQQHQAHQLFPSSISRETTMGESEELESLKRAYAEMILNTAKEAASRVMASEIKARNVEMELISSKEEASRMLLRLKQMMDAKTKEAEIALFNQQRRIDEIEAQLNEAEGIILDLRAELNQAQEELVEEKNKSVHLLRTNDVKSQEVDTSNLEHEQCGLVSENAKWNSECHICCVDNPVLVTEKKPELSSDDCTLTDVIVDGELPSADDLHSSLNSETTEPEMELTIPSPKMEKLKTMENFRIGAKRQPIKSCNIRRKRTQTSKARAIFSKQHNRQYLRPHRTHSARSCSSGNNDFNHAPTKNENVNTVEISSGLEEKVNLEKNQAVRRSLRKRKPKYWGDAFTSRRSSKIECSLKCDYNQLKREDKSKTEECDNVIVSPNSEFKIQQENYMELTDVLVKLDEQAARLELSSFSPINCDLADDAKTPAGSQAECESRFKHTFSRKRKIESLTKLKDTRSSAEGSLRKRTQERDGRPSRLQNCTLMNKSPKNNRRILQVARQLISLSGKH